MLSSQPRQIRLPIHRLLVEQKFTFVDLFAGIGGFRIALEKLGGKCVGFSEIDRKAIETYQANFSSYLDREQNLGNIELLEILPNNIDILTGGVPCQSWSVAGKLKGFNDPRGRLWFDTLRLTQKSQPKAFIFENVRGMANPKHRSSLEFLLKEFEQVGYCVKWKILNAYDYGIPQNRERLFLVGIRKDIKSCQEYRFPEPLNLTPKLYDILDEIDGRLIPKKNKLTPEIIFSNGTIPPSRTRFQKNDELNDFFIFSDLRNGHTTIHSWDILRTSDRQKEICLTLLKYRRHKRYGEKDGNPLSYEDLKEHIVNLKRNELSRLVNKGIFRLTPDQKYEFVNSKNMSGIFGVYRIILPSSDVVPTITATGTKNFYATKSLTSNDPEDYKKKFLKEIYRKKRYRPFEAKHFCRLQGFPDNFIFPDNFKVAEKQFGNAVPVPVVYHVSKEVLKLIL
ncbi:MAG: DNA cytosine methyltransferase [Cyanobacteria bacterium P01_E01_bin.42]